MPEEPTTEELQAEALKRELAARRAAEAAPDEEETAQYERRAEKAHYLREKLQDRAAAEQAAEEDG